MILAVERALLKSLTLSITLCTYITCVVFSVQYFSVNLVFDCIYIPVFFWTISTSISLISLFLYIIVHACPFLCFQYIGTLDVPRPSSRVEIVAAMRRIRVSCLTCLAKWTLVSSVIIIPYFDKQVQAVQLQFYSKPRIKMMVDYSQNSTLWSDTLVVCIQ